MLISGRAYADGSSGCWENLFLGCHQGPRFFQAKYFGKNDCMEDSEAADENSPLAEVMRGLVAGFDFALGTAVVAPRANRPPECRCAEQ